jgi:tetratricopeptide (TPR) repeat protein
MPDTKNLVLEVWKEEKALGMGLFEQDQAASTLRYYHQQQVSFSEITRLCQDIAELLSRAGRKEKPEAANLEELKKAGQFLWDHLLARKVKERLSSSGPLDLALSLDEELISIPWELLYNGRDFLCLKFSLGRLLRTKQESPPLHYRSCQPVLKMLILADPTADLRSAYQEGLSIRNRFDRFRSKMQIDFKSTAINRLYVKKNLRDYDLVHYAGHCEYDGRDTSASGWLLEDGRLTLKDIAALGGGGALPSLIFSNACFSAGARDFNNRADYQSSTYSLASAFLFSGVRHYIGALRELEDRAGLIFAQAFYAFLTRGRSVGESLRLARQKLAKDFGPSRLSWAGYLLYGDPSFVLFKVSSRRRQPAAELPGNAKRRRLLKILPAVFLLVFLFLAARLYLPTINPNTLVGFSQLSRLFEQGRNNEVIALTSRLIKKDPMFLAAYPLLADTYQRLGKDKEALQVYFDYMLSSQKRNDRRQLAQAYIKIGWFYQGKGAYRKAGDFYQKARLLSLATKDKLGEAIALRKQAVWYIDQGQYDQALELLLKSSEINRERIRSSVHRYQLACDYFDIGLVFINKDDPSAAAEFYQKSFRLFKQLRLKSELSDYYFNLGEIRLFNKDYQEALDCYRRGLAIDQAQGNLPSLASDYIMLGDLYLEMDNLKDAESSLDKAVAICGSLSLPREEAEANYDLGQIYAKRGQKNKAREFYRRAQEIYYSIDPAAYQEIKSALRELDNLKP